MNSFICIASRVDELFWIDCLIIVAIGAISYIVDRRMARLRDRVRNFELRLMDEQTRSITDQSRMANKIQDLECRVVTLEANDYAWQSLPSLNRPQCDGEAKCE